MLKVGNIVIEATAIGQSDLLFDFCPGVSHINATEKAGVMCQTLLVDQTKVEDESRLSFR